MAISLMTSRPYILTSTGASLFRQTLPLLYHSKKSFVSQTVVFLTDNQNKTLFRSCSVNKPIRTSANSVKVASKARVGLVGQRSFTAKATHVNDAGSIDSSLMQSMEKKIKEHLNAESVVVRDASGDGRHVCIDVVSSAFEGQSAVNRQRMVYKAIWEELQNTVHAVDQMTTKTPGEAAVSLIEFESSNAAKNLG
ncbi:hypothetical protein SLA2020_325550 [Shorea laevis]